ncbi:MAG: hypothetical protein ACJ757_04915 [Gaiellaceae bacterium]
MKHRFTAPFVAVLVLALVTFTGSALAGDGQGNGSGGDNGNSANAPGHQTTQAPAPAAVAAASAQLATQQPSKHESKSQQSKQSPTSATNPATGGDNSHGVKPSNTTYHDTYATASSDQTKQYGNGKTAGQIATQAGYGNAVLHGPGNSQPHKTAPCPGSKHEVDVHALKNKASKCGSAQPTVVSTQVVLRSTETSAAPAASAIVTSAAVTTPATVTAPAAAGGVQGAVVALKPTKPKPSGGVLGATTRLGGTAAATRLPFTGLPLWIFTGVALGLIGIGFAFRRASLDRIQ